MQGLSCTMMSEAREPKCSVIDLIAFATTPSSVPFFPECTKPIAFLGAFSLLHRIPESPVWVSNVTEVPAVFGAVADHFVNVWPHYDKTEPAPEGAA